GFVAQGHLHVEVKHSINAKHRGCLGPDPYRHLRPGPFLPPVWEPDGYATLLERRYAPQELIGPSRRPRHGLIDGARVHQLLHPCAALGRLLHRGQELDERRPILRPGVLFERLAQRQVLQPSRRTKASVTRPQKGKGPPLLVLFSRQMKPHPPHLMPLRRPRLQERFESTRRDDRLVRPTIQSLPNVP